MLLSVHPLTTTEKEKKYRPLFFLLIIIPYSFLFYDHNLPIYKRNFLEQLRHGRPLQFRRIEQTVVVLRSGRGGWGGEEEETQKQEEEQKEEKAPVLTTEFQV